MQVCPQFTILPQMIRRAAIVISTDSSTYTGLHRFPTINELETLTWKERENSNLFPPSSNVTGVKCLLAASRTILPMLVDPVKKM